jgi:hypothetical protein
MSDECHGSVYSYCKGPEGKRVCHGIFFTDATKLTYTLYKKLNRGTSVKMSCDEASVILLRATSSTLPPTESPETEVFVETTEAPIESQEITITTTARPELVVAETTV